MSLAEQQMRRNSQLISGVNVKLDEKMPWLHESLLNRVTPSYAVTGTEMKTQGTQPEVGLDGAIGGAFPTGTQTPEMWLTAESCPSGNALRTAGRMNPTLIDRGVPVHRSDSGAPTARGRSEDKLKVTALMTIWRSQTIMMQEKSPPFREDQITETGPSTTGAGGGREGCTTKEELEETSTTEISHISSILIGILPPKKDPPTTPSGTRSQVPLRRRRRSPAGRKETDAKSGRLMRPEARKIWTPKCRVRGWSVDGASAKMTAWRFKRRKPSPSKWT